MLLGSPMNFRSLLCSAALIPLLGCSGSSPAASDANSAVAIAQSNVARIPSADVPAGALAGAVAANNAFAVNLYREALKPAPDKNLLTSPISATLALTMTYAGAQGKTKTEMAAALQLAQLGESVFAGQNALSQALNGRAAAALDRAQKNAAQGGQPAPSATDYQLQVVNSVWGEKTYSWEQPFLDTLAADYGTGVYQRDFKNAFDPARLAINDWVSSNTNDKIKDLLSPGALDDTTRLVLVNAIHLKLPWADTFDARETTTADFQRAGGTSVATAFMHRTDELAYLDDGKAQIVSLPLSNGELSIVIALPHEGTTLADYEGTLAASSAPLSTPSAYAHVALSLPKATFTSPSVSLSAALKTLGMRDAFNPDLADFSGLCAHTPDGRQLYVSDVLQKAMISMQETGAEAAAATAVVVAAGLAIAIDPPVVVPMNVNRPYLVAIVDNPTGAVLMLGHIQDPTDAGSN